jgi:hypothetical protein
LENQSKALEELKHNIFPAHNTQLDSITEGHPIVASVGLAGVELAGSIVSKRAVSSN